MTRETKIGLLVGLAFIIVIGILLSDHLTSSTEPPQATLANAGNSVRQTVNTPGTPNPPITITPPANVNPQQPVPTRDEVQRPEGVQIVRVVPPTGNEPTGTPTGGASSGNAPVVSAAPQVAPPANPPSNPPVTIVPPQAEEEQVVGADPPTITRTPEPLAAAAARQGEQIVPVSANGSPRRDNRERENRTGDEGNWTTALTGLREYQAQPGDTLSKIAGRTLGANTKANRDAIIKANPSLQADPNKIIAGRTYLIPEAPAGTETAQSAQTPAREVNTRESGRESSRDSGEYWYTVKPQDSLWRIANEQLGKPSAVAAIKELNADILKGSDTVHPGMKLRLPAKPVAMAD